jgi:ABC-type branched-subunit amino acid transport system substrate-binding protein
MLSDDDIARIADRIVARQAPLVVGTFGSYATGTARAGSDLDLFVINDDAARPVARRRAIERLLFSVLHPLDVLGKPFLAGVREGLGPGGGGMIVKEASYEVSDPTVDSQVVALQGSGADTLIMVATPKPAAQAIRKAHDIGWMPQRYLFSGSASIIATLKPAGLDKSKGVVTALYGKDPTDPRWKDDPKYKEFAAFVTKYMSAAQLSDPAVVYGFAAATLMSHVLKQCGDDLSRENILRQATNIKDFLNCQWGSQAQRSTLRPRTTSPFARCNFQHLMARTGNPSAI